MLIWISKHTAICRALRVKNKSNISPCTHYTLLLSLCQFVPLRFFSPSSFCPMMYGFFLQWLFQSAARDVINFIHTLWIFCLGRKKKERKRRWDDVRREEGREREQPKERRREGRGYGVAEEDFQCSCMYNKWGGTLFETPARRFTSRFAGQSEALWSHTSHPFYPANRCFHLALWFDPVEKQITFSEREREGETSDNGTKGWVGRVRRGWQRKEVSLSNNSSAVTPRRYWGEYWHSAHTS